MSSEFYKNPENIPGVEKGVFYHSKHEPDGSDSEILHRLKLDAVEKVLNETSLSGELESLEPDSNIGDLRQMLENLLKS
jgi:hypothetical protein